MGWDDDMRNLTLDCFLLTLKYVKHQYEVRKLPNDKVTDCRKNRNLEKNVSILQNSSRRFRPSNLTPKSDTEIILKAVRV